LEEQDLELLNSPGTGTFFSPNINRESVLCKVIRLYSYNLSLAYFLLRYSAMLT
ncbi:uncharacterized protein M421DRAFT_405734, partial [Didymella exigua CBS 183.55]